MDCSREPQPCGTSAAREFTPEAQTRPPLGRGVVHCLLVWRGPSESVAAIVKTSRGDPPRRLIDWRGGGGGGGAGGPRHHPSAVPVRQAMHVVAELPRWGEAPSRWSTFVTAGRSFLVRRRFFHALLLIPALHTQGAPFLGFNPSSTGPSACFVDVCKRMQKALC